MLCRGERHSWEVNKLRADNAEIVRAFSTSDALSLHCIINTAGREIFVVASSCRAAKIISVYYQHLQAVSCGRCSRAEMQKFTERGPQFFGEKLQAALQSGEPTVLWYPGYVSEQLSRLAKEKMERLMMGIKA